MMFWTWLIIITSRLYHGVIQCQSGNFIGELQMSIFKIVSPPGHIYFAQIKKILQFSTLMMNVSWKFYCLMWRLYLALCFLSFLQILRVFHYYMNIISITILYTPKFAFNFTRFIQIPLFHSLTKHLLQTYDAHNNEGNSKEIKVMTFSGLQ